MRLHCFLSNLAKTFLAVGALSVSAFAGADSYYGHNDHQNYGHYEQGCHNDYNCNTHCNSNSDCGCGHPVNPAPECGWAYNPPAYTRCGCNTGCSPCNSFLDSFAFRADFLWWRACEDGLDLGTEESVEFVATTAGRNAYTNRAHEKRPNFKYDPGFRIGLASACACDCWDFAVNWTHFRTKANVSGTSDPEAGVTFFSEWERVVGAGASLAHGRYTLNLDLVDLEFGRKFYVSNCFVLRPEFGLRFARINQHYRVESETEDGPVTSILTNFVSDSKSRSDFLAVGPRAGADLELHFCGGLSLFGQAAGSIVFGKFDNHSREHLTDFTRADTTAIGSYGYEEHSSAHRCSRVITDFAFGIKWERCFEWCNRSHPISLAFAWEHHAFWEMNDFNFVARGFDFDQNGTGTANGNHNDKHGSLYTQGLTLSLAFGF